MPVAVEMIHVYDSALADTIASMTATQWFRRRADLEWRHPDGFESWQWEWTPGQTIGTQQLPVELHTHAVYLFAEYESAGAHRAKVPPFRSIELELGATQFQSRPVR
jgi:hypothetical protein